MNELRTLSVMTALVLTTACGVERTWTQASVVVRAETAPRFTTRSGWTIEPRKAVLHLESLRLSEAQLALAWWRSALVGTARAHPGHGDDGSAVGELIAPMALDLTSSQSLTWGNAVALTGDVHSLNISLAPPGLEVEGVATRDGQRVEFARTFVPGGPLAVPFELRLGPEGGALTLSLDVAHLVSRLDFSSDEALVEGLARGTVDSGAWSAGWSGGAP